MDLLTLGGIALALLSILGGQVLEGGHVSSLVNGPAFVIVVGGTVGAVLLQAPLPVFLQCIKRLGWLVKPPVVSMDEMIAKIVEWSQIARKSGLLGLENLIETESDQFAARGLQLLVDGAEPEDIRHALETELTTREEFDHQGAKLLEAAGGYAPTIGIIGAVMGLIHVMENLADPSKLGSGIAAAFVATVYGVGSANLFFLPAAAKLKSVVNTQTKLSEMTIEGILAIAHGENPRNIESRLKAFKHA